MDYSELDSVIDLGSEVPTRSGNKAPNTVTIMSADPVEALSARMNYLLAENQDLKTRVKTMEGQIQMLMYKHHTERDKGSIKPPFSGYFDATPSRRLIQSVDEDPSEVTESPSMLSLQTDESFSKSLVDNSIYSTASMSGTMKLSSATAAMGYTNKKSVWGSALASMLIAMVRYYCVKTGRDNIFLDETQIMKTCIYLAPVFYEMSHKELPSVKSPATKFMSSSISRSNSSDVPQSTAESWYQMTSTQDGRDCLTVIETMIKYAKKMPEVLSHPLSNIVPYVQFPVVKKLSDGSVIFCISKKIKLRNGPDQWELWCSLLKSSALIKYAKWRGSDNSATTSATNMMSEMKVSELVDKKNSAKFINLMNITDD